MGNFESVVDRRSLVVTESLHLHERDCAAFQRDVRCVYEIRDMEYGGYGTGMGQGGD